MFLSWCKTNLPNYIAYIYDAIVHFCTDKWTRSRNMEKDSYKSGVTLVDNHVSVFGHHCW